MLQDNWFHECMTEALKAVHAAIDAKANLPEWPKILPVAQQDTLKPRRGLRQRFEVYDAAARKLKKPHRDRILKILVDENDISQLLSGQKDCGRTSDLPAAIREPVKSLFGFAFDLLTPLKVRDEQYKAIYDATKEHVCPFCGTEYFDAPKAKREALDHYLAFDHYPFAAANMRNLVPMGHKCNSSYKLAKDILRDASGVTRIAFDPYDHEGISLHLDQSEPFGGTEESLPLWDIQFFPASSAIQTWDEVFSIVERYQRDHLDPTFNSWLRLFGRWVEKENIPTKTDKALIGALRRFEESWDLGGIPDRAFLKAAVFRMLRKHCEAGNKRLLAKLHDIVTLGKKLK